MIPRQYIRGQKVCWRSVPPFPLWETPAAGNIPVTLSCLIQLCMKGFLMMGNIL